jgi:hypothetical protein
VERADSQWRLRCGICWTYATGCLYALWSRRPAAPEGTKILSCAGLWCGRGQAPRSDSVSASIVAVCTVLCAGYGSWRRC